MAYTKMKFREILKALDSEEKARAWIWLAKFDGLEFLCPDCQNTQYYQLKHNQEIRKCKHCGLRVRIRANTIFENSKIPLLIWLKALCFITQGKRGISALELQSALELKSYATTWGILHKIREAFKQRDDIYKLNEIIELDGAFFGKKHTGNQAGVLVAIESKDWFDNKGRAKTKAGFAKVVVADEKKEEAQHFVDQTISQNSVLHTDNDPALTNLENVTIKHKTVSGDKELLAQWLPWVHKFISNAKSWLLGMHHGVDAKYLGQYLAEYTYRFNRRHDPDSLFFRGLGACVKANPITLGTLSG